MAGIPISAQHGVRVALIFVALILGFGILSSITGWPDKQSWGTVVFLSLVIAALPLIGPLLSFLRESGAVVDIKGVKLDFSATAVRGASVEATDLGLAVGDSRAVSILDAAEAAETAAFVVVDLGTGKSWYPTRLFVLAAAADVLRGARAVVILAQHARIPGRFLGWITPKDVVAAFFQDNKQYSVAFDYALVVLRHLRLSGGDVKYEFPAPFENDCVQFRDLYRKRGDIVFVQVLIQKLQSTPANPEAQQAHIEGLMLENISEPNWLSREDAKRLFDAWLIPEFMRDGLPDADKRAMLAAQNSRDFLAVAEDNGTYRGMIEIDAAMRSLILSSGNTRA